MDRQVARKPATLPPRGVDATVGAEARRGATDIAAFLATLKDPANKVKEPQPGPTRTDNGKRCFRPSAASPATATTKSPLDGLGSKWLTGQLAEYLENPQHVDHSGRMPSLQLDAPAAPAIAEYLIQSKNPAFEAASPAATPSTASNWSPIAGLPQLPLRRGAKGKPMVNAAAIVVAPLEKLGGRKAGCLAENPTGKAMNYGLTAPQREQIAAFLASMADLPLISAAPVYDFYHKIKTFGCTNCHELDSSKPPDETERIPQLTNIGGRLRKAGINEVLTQKQRVRPWLHRRMPEFGPANVGMDSRSRRRRLWRRRCRGNPDAGARRHRSPARSCSATAPADWPASPATASTAPSPTSSTTRRGPDITTAAARLRPDHFRRWVLDPKRVAPSTPMPSFFEGGPPDESAAKIETIFRYVALGPNMPPPVGWIDKNNYVLAVHEDPLVIRSVLPNPNGGRDFPRGIAVGLPELINYCFDADTCELRYAWTGGFLDMQPSWSHAAARVVNVLGKRFYTTSGFPLSIGDGITNPQTRIHGYAFVNKRPQFIYRVGECRSPRDHHRSRKGHRHRPHIRAGFRWQSVTFTLPRRSRA